jgi:UDP-2,4-diacetamido-2,4,6-trideoxy-beta-L-altropyranose hydrolase
MAETGLSTAGMTMVVRADADAGIGTGHVMRCLALAAGWIDRGGAAVFLSKPLPAGIANRLTDAGIGVVDAVADEAANARRTAESGDVLVVDGVRFGADDLSALAGSGLPTLAIDDLACLPRYPVDLLLNQNLHASASDYAGRTEAGLLLGPAFALLRADIRRWAGWERLVERLVERRVEGRVEGRARRVLLLSGGADPKGVAFRLIEAVGRVDGIEARLVVGAANPRLDEVREAAGDRVSVLHDVRDMADLYRWCDVAVSAAGSTVWEMALFATPMLLGATNPSEEPSAELMDAQGAARYVGRLDAIPVEAITRALAELVASGDLRRSLGAAARRIVDGGGVDRVVDRIVDRVTARALSR